jgi:hypothetical protein
MRRTVFQEAAIVGVCVLVGLPCLLLKLYVPVVIATVGIGLVLGSMLLETIEHYL